MYAHAKELANDLVGEDPSDIQRLHTKLMWMGASMGRSGMTTQAIAPFDIALWDLKARRAGLPLAKLIGAQRDSVRLYNTSGGFLHTPLEQVLENVAALVQRGIGGIKLKVGQPDFAADLKRVTAVRKLLGDGFPLMVDANQQWERTTAMRYCRALEPLDLTWIEEPLDAYDAEGHAELARALDTPIATGEMLTSFAEHARLIEAGAADFVQPDAPRVGGVTPFLQVLQLMEYKGLALAPHFAMEVHVHLAATFSREPWTEHFEWLEPLFDERLEIRGGRMHLPARPGLGFTLSQQARRWTAESARFGKRP
jgi:L-alanine-DL-glutamate epimerase-like enolase superfamily enzyme